MEHLGRYRIVSELGRGAMGIVYRAEDPKIGREVAIKTIRLMEQGDPSETERLRERLFREAQSAGRLSHPTIVTIYDIAEESGVAYIAMEFVEGKTLERLIDGGEIPNTDFVSSVIRETAEGLDYAHAKGIVHRDIKPANIIVTPDGRPKITDFGIARIGSSKFTQTGTVMGTPSYMSPEQIRGDGVDGRSDQFSLGVMAYEMLAGEKPFQAESLPSLMFKIVSGPVIPPKELNPKLTEPLNQAILRVLEKNPNDRHATCREFADAIAAACEQLADKSLHCVAAAGSRQQADSTAGDSPTEAEATVGVAAVESGTSAGAAEDKEFAATLPPLTSRTSHATAAGMDTSLEVEEGGSRRSLFWISLFAAAVCAAALTLFLNPALLKQVEELLYKSESEMAEAESEGGVLEPLGELPDLSPENPQEDALPAPQEVVDVAPGDTAEEASQTGGVQDVTEVAEETAPPPDPAPPPPPPSRPRPIAVALTSNELGATVRVDGSAELTCTTPCTLELTPGRHTAIASLSGFRVLRKIFEVSADSKHASFELERLTGTLLISSSPTGAAIYINGKMHPQPTNSRLALPPGEYSIRVVKEGIGELEQQVSVGADELRRVGFNLDGR